MLNLVLNENMKLYRRWRTWVMIGFMIGAVLLGSFMEWYYDGAGAEVWRGEVQEEKLYHEERLQNSDVDKENKEYSQDQIALLDYHIEHDIRTEAGTMWDGINGAAELIILITLLTAIIAGDSMASEFSTGTIKLLLIRPASRLKILISKYLSMIMFGVLLLIILFVVSVLANGLLYQFDQIDLPLISMDADGHIVEKNMVANLWKTYLLNSVSTIIFVTMAFMISTAFRSSSMAIGFTIFLLFAGFLLLELVHRYEWSKYILFANIDLSQHLTGRPFQEGMTLSFSIIVLSVYFIIFNLVAWLMFTRRDVAA